jgi:NAD-dependent SIR2 family protein deacetylase
MQSLYALVKEKPHFVVTSNTDDHFAMAGFDRKNIFEIEGNMRKMQCARGCHDIAYYSHDVIMNMLEHEEGMEIPNKYIPKCRKCNGTMIPHIAINKYFVQDREWNNSYRAYQSFVKDNHDKKLLILELGVGARNHMIKAPFMELVNEEESAFYITFNKG